MLEDPRLISLFNVMRRHYLEKIPLYMYASCIIVSPHAASLSAPIPTVLVHDAYSATSATCPRPPNQPAPYAAPNNASVSYGSPLSGPSIKGYDDGDNTYFCYFDHPASPCLRALVFSDTMFPFWVCDY